MNNDVPIRDAATIVLLRQTDAGPSVLMGQRGANAAFMASKFVFPGGAVDPDDGQIPQAAALEQETRSRLAHASTASPEAVAHAAIRELWEEAGLALGTAAAPLEGVPADWTRFYGQYRPAGDKLRFFFRAVTPQGRPRRFDARFFLCPATAVAGDLDDFSAADDELSHLQWVPLARTRELALPFVTELVLSEVAALGPNLDAPPSVPFFRQGVQGPRFEVIGA